MIDYKGFIETYFQIIEEDGTKSPFKLNDIQLSYYNTLKEEYGADLTGARENVLKARREGFSSFIEALFMADFILSTLGKLPVISGQVVSHKAEEVTPHIRRSNLYLDSYLEKEHLDRKTFLKMDNTSYIESVTGAEYFVGTAGAKTLGRGGTLQNLHWTEVAFYPNTEILNAENIIYPAEQQIKDGIGKIFRESTGNTLTDYFAVEYYAGKNNETEYKSRFFPWFMFKSYRKEVPQGFEFTQENIAFMDMYFITPEQMYWYIQKVLSKRGVTKDGESRLKKARREYPTTDREAFLVSGQMYFTAESIEIYQSSIRKPIVSGMIYV